MNSHTKKYLILIALFLSMVSAVSAQDVVWKVGYDFIGDNREYTTYYGFPETILCSRLSAELGYQFDSCQRIMAGGSYLITHGADMFEQKPVLTMYYQYKNKYMDFQLGSFPIEQAMYPNILYTDSLLYYRPNYQGARSIFTYGFGSQTLLFDWYKLVDSGYEEKFLTGFSGISKYKDFFITDMFYYRHHAHGARGKKSVADNGGFGLNLGYAAPIGWLDSCSASVGFVKTWYSNKKDTTIVSPLRSMGVYATAYIQKKMFAINAIYYNDGGEGTHLPCGDPLFRCGNYARIDGILYVFQNKSNVDASFKFCGHYVDGTWDNSQQIMLRVRLGNAL